MTDLLDSKNGQIEGAVMAAAIITKSAEFFGVKRCTLSKVMTENPALLKQNSGR